jgi:hypothetical protein
MTEQPHRHWDGQKWLVWNGTEWVAEAPSPPVYAAPAPGYAPPGPGYAPPAQAKTRGKGCLIAVLILAVLFVAGVAVFIAILVTGSKAIDRVSHALASTGTSGGIDNGIGTASAIKDVVLGSAVTFDGAGLAHLQVTVTNHSSKRSDYDITVAVVSADGKTQYDSDEEFVDSLDPGQTKVEDFIFSDVTKEQVAGGAIEKPLQIQRTSTF